MEPSADICVICGSFAVPMRFLLACPRSCRARMLTALTHPPGAIVSPRLLVLVTLAALAAFPPAASAQQPAQQRADLVLLNGTVATVDSQKPDAQAVAVRGDRIVAVGTTAEIRKLVGPATK